MPNQRAKGKVMVGAWVDKELKRQFVKLLFSRGFKNSLACQEHLIQIFVDSDAVPPFVPPDSLKLSPPPLCPDTQIKSKKQNP
jgi:hypothetical protein